MLEYRMQTDRVSLVKDEINFCSFKYIYNEDRNYLEFRKNKGAIITLEVSTSRASKESFKKIN